MSLAHTQLPFAEQINYYRQKPQLTLKQAHLRFALQHLLMPQALPAGE